MHGGLYRLPITILAMVQAILTTIIINIIIVIMKGINRTISTIITAVIQTFVCLLFIFSRRRRNIAILMWHNKT